MERLSRETVAHFIRQIHSKEQVNAIIVLKSLKTLKDYTYKIRVFNGRVTRVFKIGTEVGYNEFRWVYSFSMYKDYKGNVYYIGKLIVSEIAKWLLDKLFNKHIDSILSQVELYHTGKCIKCGRTLTDLESIKYGMGKHCRNIN